MKTNIYKYSVIVVLFSIALAGCSSTNSVATMPSENITTGSIKDRAFRGSSLSTDSKVSRVFYFEFDKVILNAEARSALRLHAKSIRMDKISVRLLGHADERGSREYNHALGQRRAQAVKNYLASQGVPDANVQTISYGEERPVAAGNDEASHAENRRAELSY